MLKRNTPTETECRWIIKLAKDDMERCKQGPDANHPAMRMRIELMAGIAGKMDDHLLCEQEKHKKVDRLTQRLGK